MLQKQALWDWGFTHLLREHDAEASSVGLGLQTVAEITCCRSKLCGTGASDSCRENLLQKQALWDSGFRQLQREHAAEASSVGLGLQTVAERTCCRSKLCGTRASDSCREIMLKKPALRDGLGLQTVAERTCCRSKLCGTGASDSCGQNMLQKQALWDWGFRQFQTEHAAEASSMGLGLQTVAEITCCKSKLCGTGASDSC